MIVDVHAHYLPSLLFERFEGAAAAFPGVRLLKEGAAARLQFAGAEPTRPIAPKLSDLADRRAWMQRSGIHHQLVGGWLDSFGYELAALEGLAWSRFLNSCMREALREERRFTPLATVPLQDGRCAAEVLGEAMEAGFGGVMIGTLPKGQGGILDDPALDPFWAEAARLGAAIYIHPMFLCGEPCLADYDLVNAIGRVADTSIAVSRLLFSGHLTRFPGLKLVVSHGGAALPFVLGRLARNFAISQGKYADPRKGFEALYFDSVVFDRDALAYLLAKAGTGKVMLGSDMPFPIGDPDPLKVVGECGLAAAAREDLLSRTAQAIFRVRADCAGAA